MCSTHSCTSAFLCHPSNYYFITCMIGKYLFWLLHGKKRPDFFPSSAFHRRPSHDQFETRSSERQKKKKKVQIDDFAKRPLMSLRMCGRLTLMCWLDFLSNRLRLQVSANTPLMRSWSKMSLFWCKCHFIIAGRPPVPWNSNAVRLHHWETKTRISWA